MTAYTPYRHFPATRLAVARVPKAGCRSLTQWASEVESRAAAAGLAPTPRNGFHLNRIADAPPGTLRIATLRHPVDRVVSVYAHKIMRSPAGEWIFRYLHAPWFPRLESLEEVRTGFRRFVGTLAADNDFLVRENIHWRPQSLTVPDIAAFDIVIATGQLDELPSMVATQRRDLAWAAGVPMKRENAAGTPIADLLLDAELAAAIEAVYGGDLELLHRYGLGREFVRPVGQEPAATLDVEAELDRLRAERRAGYHRIVDRFLDSAPDPDPA